MVDILKVLIFSASAYLVLFLYAKILGKKQIAELDFTDYVVGITIGSIAAEWATETVDPWYHYLVAISIFAAFSFIVSLLESRVFFFKKILRGSPTIVISDGKLVYENMKKSHIDVHDILGLCRTKGYFDLRDVAYAIFERNGELSVLPKGANTPATVSDIIKPEVSEASLVNDVVIGGKVNQDILKALNKDQDWLFDKLKIRRKSDLKQILYASYDEQDDSFDVHKV